MNNLLCRIGLHEWSDNRGGIKICERKNCRASKTFGVTGAMRRLEWRDQLYKQYQKYTEDCDE